MDHRLASYQRQRFFIFFVRKPDSVIQWMVIFSKFAKLAIDPYSPDIGLCFRYYILELYTYRGLPKKEPPPPIKDDIPWSLPSYVMKKLIKLVFFYTLLPLGACFNKNGDSKSQIRKLHIPHKYLSKNLQLHNSHQSVFPVQVFRNPRAVHLFTSMQSKGKTLIAQIIWQDLRISGWKPPSWIWIKNSLNGRIF